MDLDMYNHPSTNSFGKIKSLEQVLPVMRVFGQRFAWKGENVNQRIYEKIIKDILDKPTELQKY